MIKDFSNLTEGEHFALYLVKRNFARYWICTGKQRTVWSFALGYLQQKAMTKFYCLMKKYIYDCLDATSILCCWEYDYKILYILRYV